MSSRALRAEASGWLARLQSDQPSAADQAGCAAWLAESAAHRAALAEVTALWEAAGGLGAACVLSAPGQDGEPGAVFARRRLLAASGAGFALSGLGLAGLGGTALYLRPGVAYATGVGEQRQVALPDGSLLFLDACSRVRCRYSASLRRLDLLRGRIALTLAADATRPFLIEDHGWRIFPLGRRLQLSTHDGALSVTALEGAVLAQPGQGAPVALAGGQRLRAARARPAVTDQPTMEAVTAWQSGRLDFVNETLGAAVREFNRYSRRRLVLSDPELAGLRLSGSYRAFAAEDFARSVAILFDLRLHAAPSQLVLARPRTGRL